MPNLLPRVLTSPAGSAALGIDDYDSFRDGRTGYEQLIFGCRFKPRGPRRLVAMNVGHDLRDRFDAAEWGFEGTNHEDAVRLMIATLGIIVSNVTDEDPNQLERQLAARNGRNQHDGWSFARGLRSLQAASDSEIWRYVAAKVYWSWRFGHPDTFFDHADNLQLGLPLDAKDEKNGLLPGQIGRVAGIGVDDFWRKTEGELYVPTVRLVQEFPDRFQDLR